VADLTLAKFSRHNYNNSMTNERCRATGFIDGVLVNDLELFDIRPPFLTGDAGGFYNTLT
jgi:hypothetical protein